VAELSDFEGLFESRTRLSCDEYYMWLLVVFSQVLDSSPPGTPRVQVAREMNVDRFCDDVDSFVRRFGDSSIVSLSRSNTTATIPPTERARAERAPPK
jgi:hypothetical protein